VNDGVQLSVVSSVESQPENRRLGGWCEIGASLGLNCQLRRGSERWKLKNLHCVKSIIRKRLVDTVID
jgi:hypothetical protein